MHDDADRLLPAAAITSLDDHLAVGGGVGLRNALEMAPAEVIARIGDAGLRGRGGAGFPTARKWSGVVETATGEGLAIVANAAEGEPGTYKDRTLIEQQPYAFLEGLCIALHATGADEAHVGIKRKFTAPVERLTQALAEIVAAGWAHADRITIDTGPDAYLFGEETGMLAVLEGDLPMPRIVKPFEVGLNATSTRPNPTIVNNVETLSHVTWIIANGAEWFREAGTESSPGTMVFTVVGDVANPGVYELALGTPLRVLLEDIAGARDIKAVYSGVSNAVILDHHLDTPLGFDELRDAGVGIGSGGFVVYDRSRSIVDILEVLTNFLAIESCGQCNPCKLGLTEVADTLRLFQLGQGDDTDLERLVRRTHGITDQNRCFLPVGGQQLVISTIDAFVDEFIATIDAGEPTPADLSTPLIDHIDANTGEVTYHPRYHLKRGDWSYADADPVAQRLASLRGAGDGPLGPR